MFEYTNKVQGGDSGVTNGGTDARYLFGFAGAKRRLTTMSSSTGVVYRLWHSFSQKSEARHSNSALLQHYQVPAGVSEAYKYRGSQPVVQQQR